MKYAYSYTYLITGLHGRGNTDLFSPPNFFQRNTINRQVAIKLHQLFLDKKAKSPLVLKYNLLCVTLQLNLHIPFT